MGLCWQSFQHPCLAALRFDLANIRDPGGTRERNHWRFALGAGSKQFREAVTRHWLPALDSFQPQLVLFCAGFDAHVEDDMAMLPFRDEDYDWVTAQVKALAARHARGRIVSMLENGYALSALGRAVVQHVRVLAGLNA